ncbi:TonB-dependent receptor plug domain-containing protein [Altererythrobacter aerius]|uniref:TonB-dependent receptor plug domain-containing protein n=1 Tax=Tsuneonella aeria TaxID=1837929 RepID=A0A6I4TGT8_9SPHN|nr:TonB-dependent receptor plug domain-containing protein [Tsuneonella aeria]MXO75844.1 TonB-dependent receptor plug domain-containing protein [Tsuneonella aeria]
MSTKLRLIGALLISSALTAPGIAHAQSQTDPSPAATPPSGETVADPQPDSPAPNEPGPDQAGEEAIEISVPGGGNEIIVTGRRERNVARSSDQVVSVLGTAEIARTGEGNIAGALARVTGLSLVGNGFVYVRGLGDRYSLALLNGSPLPSPEPLKRVVPLDLFPTGVIASSLVQKSYSANFPGEFGGGVINLTTRATPDDPFLSIGFGVSGDTETTDQLGYTYYGSKTDWLGYDNGNRDVPPALQAYFDSRQLIGTDPVDSTAIARELVTSRNALVQRDYNTQPNFSASLSGGKTFAVGDADLGVIAAAGYSNKWLTKDIIQQASQSADLSSLERDFRQVSTDQRILVNGLLGVGLEAGDNRLRLTGVYIHDTVKKAALALGQKPAQNGTADFMQQRTAWYERQLFNTQAVAELKLTPDVSAELRAGYANTKRDAPGELFFEYVRTNAESDPFGQHFVNRLNNGNGGNGGVTYSALSEDLWSGGVDLTWRTLPTLSFTAGGAWSDTDRTSSRRDFLILAPNTFQGQPAIISAIGMLRPDLLLAPGIVDGIGITLVETDPGTPAFDAGLTIKAGYLKGNWAVGPVSIDAGVRYENAVQTTAPIQVFASVPPSVPGVTMEKSYWLPAATVTVDLGNAMQVRLNGSKTIARPQFRELIAQPYYDPDSNRPYRGNPLLVDSTLINGEARFEWYFAPEQRVSVAGFYKKIDRPIEAFVTGIDLLTSFANAPEAQLYGAEVEAIKYVPLDSIGGGFFTPRRLALIANYTYTKSELSVSPDDTVAVFGAASTIATDYFRDGAPLTGQSDHIVNLQLGLESTDRLSQQTILLSYASDRVVSRGLNGTPPQPDVIESPGVRLDFVWREGFDLLGTEVEAKFEARNILGRGHREFQEAGDNRIDINSYDLGTTLALSLGVKF